ncbi:MAG: T9SS type A sorting domain-containing protein [Prevotellaceae bacterium]|jgi:hypothetical protein|nr:T9SS type A sorting domain-containing protein [Prevotellaceae bacterium]
MKTLLQKTTKKLALLCLSLFAGFWGLQAQNVTINNGTTSNGSWSELTNGTYTFTANAEGDVVLKNENIRDRLNGTGTFAGAAGNVVVKTIGSITTASAELIANNDAGNPAYLLTLDAGQDITIGIPINFRAKDGGTITTDAHSLTLLAGGDVLINKTIGLYGGNIANNNPYEAGGNGGNLIITAGGDVTIATEGNIYTQGGRGADTTEDGGEGGNGGNITITAGGDFNFANNNQVNALGGNGGGNNTVGRQTGGTGGNISITATNISVSGNGTINASGGSYSGNGGNISLTATTGNMVFAGTGQIATQGQNTTVGTADKVGGNGGNISIIANNGYIRKNFNGDIIARGENGKGAGANGVGGNIYIFGDKGVSVGCTIYAQGGANASSDGGIGAFGNITIGTNNPTVTTGTTPAEYFEGINSGYYQTNNMLVNNVTKTGSGTFALRNASNDNIKGNITIEGGVLLLKNANAVPKSKNIILDGGVLAVAELAGGTLTWTGKLLMTENGGGVTFIDGNTTLKFPIETDDDWNSAGVFKINGWQGDAGDSGTAGKLFFGANASAIGATQLSQIIFPDRKNATAQILATGEISPNESIDLSVDTLVWTNAAGDADWDNYLNWNAVKDGVESPAAEDIELKATFLAILPAGVDAYPVVTGEPAVIKASAEKYVSRLKVEYGASLLIEQFKGKYDEVEVQLLVPNDKVTFFAPNILPDGRDFLTDDLNASVEAYELNIEGTATPVLDWNTAATPGNVVYPDKGLALKAVSDPAILTWTGKFLTEDEDYPFYLNNGYSVLTNVFLADISVADLLAGTDDEVALLNENGVFDTYTAADEAYIKPTQAFFYNTAAAGELTLTEDVVAQYHGDAVATAPAYPQLTLTATAAGLSSKAYFAYDENAKSTSKLFVGTGTYAPDVFSYTASKTYQRQAFSDLEDTFDLGIRLADAAEVTFAFAGLADFDEAYLEDKTLDTVYDLKTAVVPAVELVAGENRGRFVLSFYKEVVTPPTPPTGINSASDAKVQVYVADKQLTVTAAADIKEITIIDAIGRTAGGLTGSGKTAQLDVSAYPAGIYAVKVITSAGTKTEKVVF